jgi:hypothetical protein
MPIIGFSKKNHDNDATSIVKVIEATATARSLAIMDKSVKTLRTMLGEK